MNESITDFVSLTDIEKEVVLKCIEIVQNTSNNHGYTTFDMGLIDSTIDRCVSELKSYFNLK